MAKTRTEPGTEAATQAATGSSDEAAQAEEQIAVAQTAEEKRERQAQRAAALRSVPEGALPPIEKTARSGDSTYQRDWLIANAQSVLGYPSHEVAGALHLSDKEYLGIDEAKRLVERWLATEVTTTTES